MASRRIAFAGTPAFALPALQALLDSGHSITVVLTQPDRPAGRGRKLSASPVKQLATAQGLPLLQPVTLKDTALMQSLEKMEIDVFVVVAYGLLLPGPVLRIPRFGALNIHASLLPRWRGAAPIQRAIEAGDNHLGVSIMRMDEGLDTGNVLVKESFPVEKTQSAGEVQTRMAELGARLIVEVIDDEKQLLDSGMRQDDAKATHARKLSKSEARLDWHLSADELQRKINAFNPWPVADTLADGQPLRIYRATTKATELAGMEPGVVVSESAAGVEVATGKGCLVITELQWPGGRSMSAEEFLNGRSLLGTRLA